MFRVETNSFGINYIHALIACVINAFHDYRREQLFSYDLYGFSLKIDRN